MIKCMIPYGMAFFNYSRKNYWVFTNIIAYTKEGGLGFKFFKRIQNKLSGPWNGAIVKRKIDLFLLSRNSPQ